LGLGKHKFVEAVGKVEKHLKSGLGEFKILLEFEDSKSGADLNGEELRALFANPQLPVQGNR
jgi:hypothetical protein